MAIGIYDEVTTGLKKNEYFVYFLGLKIFLNVIWTIVIFLHRSILL